VDAQTNFDLFMRYIGQTFDEKNKKISPFTEVSNNELMRSLVTGMSERNPTIMEQQHGQRNKRIRTQALCFLTFLTSGVLFL